ncbi:hypothetical protein [Haloparvum sedimenti]|uniref:hypothetical protein n=1 Tax=Haloparvum sedimenti TaxID=1678448 RepID=UPI00071E7590|nr:hypothetical protein [Haloparvum sedimenti]
MTPSDSTRRRGRETTGPGGVGRREPPAAPSIRAVAATALLPAALVAGVTAALWLREAARAIDPSAEAVALAVLLVGVSLVARPLRPTALLGRIASRLPAPRRTAAADGA